MADATVSEVDGAPPATTAMATVLLTSTTAVSAASLARKPAPNTTVAGSTGAGAGSSLRSTAGSRNTMPLSSGADDGVVYSDDAAPAEPAEPAAPATDDADDAAKQTLLDAGIKLYTLQQIEEAGAANQFPASPPTPQTRAVIMYTSGSTGVPKGVMMTHGHIVSCLSGPLQLVSMSAEDVYLSFLPLAHVLALVVENALIYCGATIGYGSSRTLSDVTVRNCRGDLTELRPTFFAAVPIIYDRIKGNIMQKITKSHWLVRFLWRTAFAAKKRALASGEPTPIWDFFIFNRLANALGGRLRFCLTGGAALSPEAHEWLQIVFGCPVLQGYGMTESCGGGALQELDDSSYGNTGPPVPSVEIKLVDVPEMGYLASAKPARGEIWVRGPSVTSGYYKNQQATSDAYMPGGWFATGDIGMWLENGSLKIIDRKKNLIKPPHGEYIAIERLESEYKNCPLVHNLLVYVDSFHNSCLAIINPDPSATLHWARQNNLEHADNLHAVCENPALHKFFLRSLQQVAEKNHLKAIEFIKGVHVDPVEWTPDNTFLTAAMKLNRQTVVNHFKPQIDKLYETLP